MRVLYSIIIGLILLVLLPVYVFAATSLPDSDPTLDNTHIFRHLLENNDFLFIARYNIPYTTTPNASVTNTFIFQFMDTDNVTILGQNEAFAFQGNGYGYGLISFYFPAATAPDWYQDYFIHLWGKPSEFASSVNYSYPIEYFHYSTALTQGNNQEELAVKVLEIARALQTSWGITLIDTSETSSVLGINGELYFRNAIPGLQVMAPSIFLTQTQDPDYTSENWTTTQAETYAGRYTGTWIGDAIQTVADLFSMDFHYIASIPILIAAVLCVVAGAAMNNINSGFLGAVAVVIYGGVQGWTPMAIIGIGTIIAAAYLGYHWFLRGAQ